MEKFKFMVSSIILLVLLGLVAYWSVNTIQSGSEYKVGQKLEQLEGENEKLKKETERLEKELGLLRQEAESYKQKTEVLTAAENPAAATVYKNQELINELQKLIDDNVVMKLKSKGTRVGILQRFLNVYKETSNKIDNDYGVSTESAIKIFQKEQGLTADGEAGPGTFKKMIEWLKKNN